MRKEVLLNCSLKQFSGSLLPYRYGKIIPVVASNDCWTEYPQIFLYKFFNQTCCVDIGFKDYTFFLSLGYDHKHKQFFKQIKKKECMRGSMPVKFFYIFDKVENTSIASHRGLRTHLIKKISLGVYIYIYIHTTKIKLYRALIKSRKISQMQKLFSTFQLHIMVVHYLNKTAYKAFTTRSFLFLQAVVYCSK